MTILLRDCFRLFQVLLVIRSAASSCSGTGLQQGSGTPGTPVFSSQILSLKTVAEGSLLHHIAGDVV
jgi:hypothetical protein